jgi:hypothetical protein
MIGVVRYDGLLDLSLSRDYRRLTHPTFYHSTFFNLIKFD